MATGYDGSIRIDTRVNSSGFNAGIKNINSGLDRVTTSLKGLAAAVGLAFGIGALVNFGKASVQAATELSNAMLGLQSIIQGQGRDFNAAQAFIEQYVSDGLIPATNAITAYKNLASRGYTDPQIQSTLQALKDSAAFGRQASLTLGEAVQTASEGLKNENSILVDNAGVTKNVAAMWKDYAASIGVGADSLTKQQKIQAEVTGIMEETRFQTGDAAKLANTYSGEVLKLGYNFNNLKIAIGNTLIPLASAVLPGINAIISGLTRLANLFAQVTTALFGRQARQQQAIASTASGIASSSDNAAKAQNKLASATQKSTKASKDAKKANDDNMASWDDLVVLQQDAATSTGSAGTGATPDAGAAGGDMSIPAGGEIGAGITVSPAVQAAMDTIRGYLSNLSNYLNTTFAPAIQTALGYISPQIEGFKQLFSNMWSDIQTLSQPFQDWATGSFTIFLQTFIETSGKIIGGLLESFHMVFSDIWNIVVFPSVQKFFTVILPMFTDFCTQVIKTFGLLFDETKHIFDKLWQEGIAPSLTEITKIWLEMWDVIKSAWDEWGSPIFDAIREAIRTTSDILQNTWQTILKPIWDMTIQIIDEIWELHLKPLLAKVLDFVGELITDALTIYNKVISPIINWLVIHLGPAFVTVFRTIGNIVKAVIEDVINIISGLITSLKGITEFLTGVFTGDWRKAWQGIQDIFKGIIEALAVIFKDPINAIISMLNALIDGINLVINGLNSIHFDIPDWVPKVGGKSFGINIPNIGQIPRLAQGAVIPPNNQFAAILGDQTHGVNIEAPLETIQQAVADVLGDQNINITFGGSMGELVRILKPEIERENNRIGTRLVTGGGR